MKIKNKQESANMIISLGLNRMLEGTFVKDKLDELRKFLNENKYPYYNLRDRANSAGEFLYKKTAEQILEMAPNYNNYTVYESLAMADEKLVLQGDIEIDKNFNMLASFSDIKLISNREAMEKPVYNLNIDLKERREPNIKGLKQVIDYLSEKELIGCVVEFTLFDTRVGVNKENLIIWELRNY